MDDMNESDMFANFQTQSCYNMSILVYYLVVIVLPLSRLSRGTYLASYLFRTLLPVATP